MEAKAVLERRKIKAHHHPCLLMGCGFVLTAIHENAQTAWESIRAAELEIIRCENLISSWKADSQTSMINNLSGISAVKVDKELYELIYRSLKISELTSGAFDICGNLSRFYWAFDNEDHDILDEEKIQELRGLMGYKNIELNQTDHSVFLKKKGMKIGFGGIGKGYAAVKAKQVMQSFGIENGLINASGDLVCWGSPPRKKEWDINIPDPKARAQSILQFTIPHGSVVTSGNFENYTVIDGKRYSHIIDPRTGYPVHGIKNVSVVSPNAEFGDAMATAISVMGVEEGINIVNRLNGLECIIIDQDDRIHYSQSLKTFDLCEN